MNCFMVFVILADLQSKKQMLNKLYKHVCDESSAMIRAEKSVSNYLDTATIIVIVIILFLLLLLISLLMLLLLTCAYKDY